MAEEPTTAKNSYRRPSTASALGPDPVDEHVGHRIRVRRELLGLSQAELGELIGVTFQQIQKYERGANRISASRLYDAARVLRVPVSYFFEDMDETVENRRRERLEAAGVHIDWRGLPATPNELGENDPLLSNEFTELAAEWFRLPTEVRRTMFEFVKAARRN